MCRFSSFYVYKTLINMIRYMAKIALFIYNGSIFSHIEKPSIYGFLLPIPSHLAPSFTIKTPLPLISRLHPLFLPSSFLRAPTFFLPPCPHPFLLPFFTHLLRRLSFCVLIPSFFLPSFFFFPSSSFLLPSFAPLSLSSSFLRAPSSFELERKEEGGSR